MGTPDHRGRSPIAVRQEAERAIIQARLDRAAEEARQASIQARSSRAAQLLADGVSARGALAVPGLAQWEVELLTSALDRVKQALGREFGWDARGVGAHADAWEVAMYDFYGFLER